MATLENFLAKLADYASNNVTALEGKIQFTLHEREDLKQRFASLSAEDKAKARAAAADKGLDTSSWA